MNGKLFEIIYEDDATNPKKAISGMKKLLEKINAPIIYGSWAFSCVSVQVPIDRKTKTIVIAEAIAPRMKNTGGYLFRIQPEAEYYLKKLAPFVYFDLMKPVARLKKLLLKLLKMANLFALKNQQKNFI